MWQNLAPARLSELDAKTAEIAELKRSLAELKDTLRAATVSALVERTAVGVALSWGSVPGAPLGW